MFLENVSEWVNKKSSLLEKNKIKVEHIINRGNKKIELGMSNIITMNAGSFDILDDGTCDIIIFDYTTTEPLFFTTLYLKNDSEVDNALMAFVEKLSSLSVDVSK